MNKERLLQLADFLEKGTHKFNGVHAAFSMSKWFSNDKSVTREYFERNYIPKREDIKNPHECNTVACIAGWACLMFDYENASNTEKRYYYDDKASEILELNYHQSTDLFLTCLSKNVTGPEAAQVIRNLVETGEVNWKPITDKYGFN